MSIALLLIAAPLSAQVASKIPGIKNDLAKAANDTDRVDALSELCFNYSTVDVDTALFFGNQAMQLSTKINYIKGIADSYNNLGWAYFKLLNMRKAEEYFKRSLEYFKQTGIKKYIKIPLANLGSLYMDETEYAKSMDCFMQVLRYDDEIKEEGKDETNTQINKAATLHQVGRLYNLMKKPGEARKYFLQALQISKSISSDIHIGENQMSIGNTYQAEGDQQSALRYYDESLQVLQKAGDKYRIGLVHENMANSYLRLKNNNEAIRQYKLAKENYLMLKSKADMFYVCIGLSEVYSAIKDSTGGITVLNEALQYATDLNNKDFMQQVVTGLSDFYKDHQDFKKAYEYLDSSYKIKDSLFTREKADALAKLQTQFETERKEKQIELLKKDQQLNLESLQKHTTFRYSAYIIICLLALTAFLIINRYRYIHRNKRLTEIGQMRNNIARDLHDDIGSTLTSINILSEVALQQSVQANSSTRNIQKIKERSADIMDRMNDIVWAINPANDALDKIILRMKEFGNELCEQAGISCNFREQGDINSIILLLKQRSDLYLIFKEALNNAVKYSDARSVEILIKKDGNNLHLAIADNGKGFDTSGSFKGNGLKNMNSRAAEINAILSIRSISGEGTNITLDIPIT
ncbi:MAG: tetratricopeptide repeat protein [Ferruginibacter sp.]